MRRWGWVCVLAATLVACKDDKPSEVPDAGPVETGPSALTEQEPNERPEQALTITRDSTVTADLAAQPNKADEDWYRLAPPAPRVADVTVSGLPGGDITLEVYDRDRNRLASINSEGDGKPERFPNLYVDGERWVRVAPARKGVGGAYTLSVKMRAANDGEEHEPNDRAVDAIALPLGQTVTAFLGHAGDEDWYRVELPETAAPTSAPAANDADSGAEGTVPPGAAAPGNVPTQGATPPPSPVPGAESGAATGTPEEGAAPLDTPPSPTGTFGGGEPAAAPTPETGVAQITDAGVAAPPPEPPSVALKIDLSAVEGVRPEISVLSAAEAPLFSLRGKEGEALSLRNIGVRATDRVVYVVVKGGWTGAGKEARRTFNASTPYTLTVTQEEAGANAELEPNDELHKATPLTAGGYREGFLAPKGDVDHFVLRTTEPVLAKVELSGVERLDLVLSMVEPAQGDGQSETVLLRANDGALKEPERLNNVSCTGACYFRVEGASRKVEGKWVKDFENAEQPYRISVSTVPDNGGEEREPNNTVDRAQELALGKAVRGTVFPVKDSDYYRVDLSDRPVRTPLRATLLGILKVDVGLYLHRVQPDGKLSLVQTADRAKGDQPESIRYSAEPGVYIFEVRDAKNREANFQDSYQLTVEEGE
ncbi:MULTISPECIES: ABC transporter substrate-binding protein [unclassified Myxococcus]|uniref:ABC transporter substrate-binding protein n=1 Tax=unclassified Myxococcus TaxID=2648731 RepID=UPI00157AFFB8|nr:MULTISPECIES: ABC transporter substrate-binding protein [unclassified Myxococcus]NTX32909.1 ABC transporter substrate-binding protein [Myxococcus sp. CA033]NTX55645.1 ABC transporter substrate-binding protein [Myxococcus sp. CA039A]